MRATTASAPPSLTELPFRRQHARLHGHLARVERLVAALHAARPAQREHVMDEIVAFFMRELIPHAEWEERVLYPLIDLHLGAGEQMVTATMRYEHRVVRRWVEELADEAERRRPDHRAFACKAERILGLLGAHCEAEEEVLLPMLEAGTPPAKLRRAAAS